MGYTLLEARTRLRTDFLDDPDGDRWTDAEIDRHLKFSCDRVLRSFVRSGTSIFDEKISVTASNGVVDMSSYTNVVVRGCHKVTGTHYENIQYVDYKKAGAPVTGNTSLRIYFASIPAFPTVDGDPLINDVNTFEALEELVIMKALEFAIIKDREPIPNMDSLIGRLQNDVEAEVGQRKILRMPRPNGDCNLAWSYDHSDNSIKISYMADS